MHEGGSVESKGPWTFAGLRDDESAADEAGLIRRELPCGLTFITKAGGTCDRCMRAITYIVILENGAGDTVHVGADCADFLMADEEGRALIRRANAELRAALRYERRVAAFEASRPERSAARAAKQAERLAEIAAYHAEMAEHLEKATKVLAVATPGSYYHTVVTKFVSHVDTGNVPPEWAWDGLERAYTRVLHPSRPIGVVGERMVVEGTVTRVHCIDKVDRSRWDSKYLVEITTDDGHTMILFAFWRVVLDGPMIQGDKIGMSVEVREHKATGTTPDDVETIVTKPRKITQLAQHIPTWHPATIDTDE